MTAQILPWLLADGESSLAVLETIVGDEVTYTKSGYGLFVVIVVALGMMGYGAYRISKKGLADWSGLAVVGAGIVVLVANVVVRNNFVKVTPQQLEVAGPMSSQVIALTDVRKVETVLQRSGKRSMQNHYKFEMADGTKHDLSGDLMDSAHARVIRNLNAIEMEKLRTARSNTPWGNPGSGRGVNRSTPQAPEIQTSPPPTAPQSVTASPATASPIMAPSPHPPAAGSPTLASGRDERVPVTKSAPSRTAVQVVAETPLQPKMPLQAKWGNGYYAAEVLDVLTHARVRIHYIGWPDAADETVARELLWIEPETLAANGVTAADETAAMPEKQTESESKSEGVASSVESNFPGETAPEKPFPKKALPKKAPTGKRPTENVPELASNTPSSRFPKTPGMSGRDERPKPNTQFEPSRTAIKVAARTALTPGMTVQAKWGGSIYAAEVVELMPDQRVKVHYVGWSSNFDQIVARDSLWVERSVLRATNATARTSKKSLPAEPRTWTDKTGKHKVEAKLLRVENGKVYLQREDGKEVALPIDKLSDEDQAFVREKPAAKKKAKADTAE